MGSQALNAQAVADHATPYGAEQALQVRAMFRVGPYEGRQVPGTRSLAFVRQGERLNGSCACNQAQCSVDQLERDVHALADVPGEDADLQMFLAWQAFRIVRKACDEAHSQQPGHKRPRCAALSLLFMDAVQS